MKEYSEEILMAYLNGQLSKEDTAEIDQAILSDRALKDKLVFMQDLSLGFESKQLKEKMIKISAKKKLNVAEISEKSQVRFQNRWFYIAAGFLLLVLASYFSNSKDNDSIDIASYMSAPIGLPTTMGVTENNIFIDGMIDYKMQDYAKALNKWNELPQNDTLQYYKAAANFGLQNYPLATEQFELLSNSQSYGSNANWYLGLIAINNQELNKAKKYIERSDHPKKSEILNLLP